MNPREHDSPLVELGPDEILIRDSRVPLECVIWAYREGATPEEIAATYPTLVLGCVYAVIAHYLAHIGDLDRYVERTERYREDARRARARHPSAVGLRLRELRRRSAESSDPTP